MLDYTFQWQVVWKRLPDLFEGAILTLELTILSSIRKSNTNAKGYIKNKKIQK